MAKQFTPKERRQIAIETGVDEQYLYQCLTGRRDMKPGKAREIEEKLKGAVTRMDLCQKTWKEIWPELDQRKGVRADTGQRKRATDAKGA
jgi:DNA-binding transcriptional regulator YdaS (Cro superfamily)